MPFAITVDYKTVEDNTATLRERDSTTQASGNSCLWPELAVCFDLCWAGEGAVFSWEAGGACAGQCRESPFAAAAQLLLLLPA